ncbi:RND superfamily putative drug exporter [Solirubrobacter pauli]|uniref:RND superfamily putative drug exporter n=1 Tax=Solirubrobacter pauli TaxID=166793 RepID=A0A660LEJ6_9ACTN|nr:MMPL family transporter [Solirubrobacter pauli]RKQ92736.1 RND superfamily putative drug exporter [Solirubrobacter pauli]
MATALYKLGRTAFRRRKAVLAVWLLVLVGAFVAAATLSGTTTDSATLPGTESQRAADLLEKRLPEANGASGRIVFAAPEGERLTGERRAAVADAVAAAAKAPGVLEVSEPQTSADGRVALAQVSWAEPADAHPEGSVAAVQAAATSARDAGLQVELGGDAVDSDPSVGGLGELIGLAVAGLVLLITFGTLGAAGMPLLTAVIGVVIGLMGITALTGVVDMDSSVPTVALMLGLAVGIDYALFIISRHRSQLLQGVEPEESAARAIGTAGSAVVFAGATVVIALASLAVVGIPFMTAMGLAAAGTVAVAVAVSLTLVPALLGFAGARLAKGKNFETGPRAARPTLGARWVARVTRSRVGAVVFSVLALGALAAPVLDMRLGQPDDSTAPPHETNRKAYDLLVDGFGPGFNGPLTIVVDRRDAKDAAEAVVDELGRLDGVADVGTPVLNAAGDTAIVSLTPRSGPSTETTKDLVKEIRERRDPLARELGATILVTGQTAANIDFADRLSDALIPYLALIVGLAFLLLLVAFRSILVPLTAVGGFLLTIGAAFGTLVAVFQQGAFAGVLGIEQTAPIVSVLPIFIVGILFGLAMDYQVFLVSRMREEHVHGAPPTRAVTEGFRHGARVVTGAALIMIGVFAGFVAEDTVLIKSIGFTLACGILIDAFVVRMTLIPALMAMLGERAWWLPGWLDRALPRVDIEGEQLARRLERVA